MKLKNIFLLSYVFITGIVSAAESSYRKGKYQELPPAYASIQDEDINVVIEEVRELGNVASRLAAIDALPEEIRWEVGRTFCVDGTDLELSEVKNFIVGLWNILPKNGKKTMASCREFTTGKTVTRQAVDQENLGLFKETLKYGADSNQNHKGTPLAVILAGHLNPKFLKVLVKDKKLLIDSSRDSDGSTALMAAVKVGRFDSVKCLLGKRADIGVLDHDGKTIKDVVEDHEYGRYSDNTGRRRWYQGTKKTKELVLQKFAKRARGKCNCTIL